MIRTDRDQAQQPSARLAAHVLILEARFYDDIADMLAEGAVSACEQRGVSYERVTVPGALELPQVLAAAVQHRRSGGRAFDGAIALGCVIRGETAHYDIVCNNTNHWLMHTAMAAHLPLGNAVLTVDTREQAVARAEGGINGKGGDAARACFAVIEIQRAMAAQQQ